MESKKEESLAGGIRGRKSAEGTMSEEIAHMEGIVDMTTGVVCVANQDTLLQSATSGQEGTRKTGRRNPSESPRVARERRTEIETKKPPKN